jgi:hypothetical protein
MSDYFHPSPGGGFILNTFAWANSQNPKAKYLQITEALSGVGTLRKIVSIVAKRWSALLSSFEIDFSIDIGVHLSFKNGKR